MTSLYQIENIESIQKLLSLLDYTNSAALKQPIHVVEGKIFEGMLSLGKMLLKDFIKNKGPGIHLAKNQNLPFHSYKNKNYLSIFGKITISRAYFWKTGNEGVCPLDAELNLPDHHHSYLLEKWIQGQIAQGPYGEAINNISDLLNLKLTKRVSQEITLESSKKVDSFYNQKNNFDKEGTHIICQIDCKGVVMVPEERPVSIIKEEFTRRAKGVSRRGIRKDAVVTADYSINPKSRTPDELLEGLMFINSNKTKQKKSADNFRKDSKPINKQISATMFGKEKAFNDLANRVHSRDISDKKPIYLLIDGAVSLEKGFNKEITKRGWEARVEACCLDIVHATEYLWDASTALYGETSPKRVDWVRRALLNLLNSNVKTVNKELLKIINNNTTSSFKARRLQRTLTYFENHIHMMNYKEYLNKGFPIASGAIEGACNTLVKDRTDRSGMQWTKLGAQAVINLRSTHCNNDWGNYWNYYIEEQSKNLYGECKRIAA